MSSTFIMKAQIKPSLRLACYSFGAVCAVAVILQFGVLASSAQTGIYLFTGSETTITLNPGTYDITAYGAQGGDSVGAVIRWRSRGRNGGPSLPSQAATLTLLVGGGGGGYPTAAAVAAAAVVSLSMAAHHWSSPAVAAAAATRWLLA